MSLLNENSKITELKGVGEKTEKLFAKVGVTTCGDLLRYYPRRYDIFETPVQIQELTVGKLCAVCGVVTGKVGVGGSKYKSVTTATLKDQTGSLHLMWFNMPYLRSTLSPGTQVVVRGIVTKKKDQFHMEHPEIFTKEAYEEKLGCLQPVYPLTASLTNNLVTKQMKQLLEILDLSQDILPSELRLREKLCEYNYAIRQIHFPGKKEEYILARERLVFEEFLLFVLALRMHRQVGEKEASSFAISPKAKVDAFVNALPFALTGAQKKVWEQIQEELYAGKVMSRLVQGDVGSGKTILAVLALILVGLNGYQGAMMAPTEVLARQHYESITSMFEMYQIPLKVELLTGSMTARQKREAYKRIAQGEVQVVLGTHALIQEKVEYQNLALVITDEQHRFGVKQRETFAGKGNAPHILVMSATPIPRTLAIILYGDLDISVVDELPAERLPIKNCVVDTGYRATAYKFIQGQIDVGHQAYIICPMVEESEFMDAENVQDYARSLEGMFKDDVKVGVLHGKMKQKQKDEIMEAFAANQMQILVSTTVVEVGINVPNATVMMIENAERFGLAQLHQLRGRVGRGSAQSYCIFMMGEAGADTRKRLDILNKSNDGFKIANEDLKLRGPGDLFGIRQSGLMDFRLGDVFQDAKLLQRAAQTADEIYEKDPELSHEEHALLKLRLLQYANAQNLEETL